MAKRAVVGFVVLAGALMLGGVAMASGGAKGKAKPKGKKEGEDTDTTTTDAPTDDDIIITIPDNNNIPPVVIDPDELEDVINDVVDKGNKAPPVTTPEGKEIAEDLLDEVVDELEKQGIAPDPVTEVETRPENDPNGSVLLARRMLGREMLPGWKGDLQDSIETWQEKVGLNPDGKFGIKSAAEMALEVGIMPLVRYWPANVSKKEALERYRAAMSDSIAQLEAMGGVTAPHRKALARSIDREKAVTWGNDKPGAQKTGEWARRVIEELDLAPSVEAWSFVEGQG